MADVRTLIRWGIPPCFIMIVVLLKFSAMTRPSSLEFAEIFAGAVEVSKALKMVLCQNCSATCNPVFFFFK